MSRILLATFVMRLCRRTVRRGSAFPQVREKKSGLCLVHEAQPRNSNKPATERHSLSALCAGRAAVFAFHLSSIFCLLFTAHCALLSVSAQSMPQPSSPLYGGPADNRPGGEG